MEIINCEKLEMLLLTKEEKKPHSKQEFCYICKREFGDNVNKKYCKVQDHCHHTGK